MLIAVGFNIDDSSTIFQVAYIFCVKSMVVPSLNCKLRIYTGVYYDDVIVLLVMIRE